MKYLLYLIAIYFHISLSFLNATSDLKTTNESIKILTVQGLPKKCSTEDVLRIKLKNVSGDWVIGFPTFQFKINGRWSDLLPYLEARQLTKSSRFEKMPDDLELTYLVNTADTHPLYRLREGEFRLVFYRYRSSDPELLVLAYFCVEKMRKEKEPQ